MHINRTEANLELIVADPGQSFRWFSHDYPCELARWHYHPEYELHLIDRSVGHAFIGDYIGDFEPGDLYLIGPFQPHNWVSHLQNAEIVKGRDVLVQFTGGLVETSQNSSLPELAVLSKLLADAKHGVLFTAGPLDEARTRLRGIGENKGLAALGRLLTLLDLLASNAEWKTLSSEEYAPDRTDSGMKWFQDVSDYVLSMLEEPVMLAQTAKHFRMSESTFSRRFHHVFGMNFSTYLRKLRVGRACALLRESNDPVTAIAYDCGYRNISNFNRQFATETGRTPSAYRSLSWSELR